MFCREFGRLFDEWSYSGRDKMLEKSAIAAALRQRLFIVQIFQTDVLRKSLKPFHEDATIKLLVKMLKLRKFRTQQLDNVDLG